MGLFSTIVGKIFGTSTPVSTETPAPTQSPTTPTVAATEAAAAQAAAPIPAPVVEIDAAAFLNDLASKNSEKLDWKRSIVDLLKLLDMDSSLAARKELAKELNYTGDTSDSASMNIWLNKEVLRQIAKNGGKLPAELLD